MADTFNSIWDRNELKKLNDLAKSNKAQGKAIQDLVANGQLTEEQYAELIRVVNDTVKTQDFSKLEKRIEDIITTPAEGINQEEIIDARQGEESLGGNISKIRSALDYSFENKIKNSDFSTNTDAWHVEDGEYDFQDGVFTIVDVGSYNLSLKQLTTEVVSGHKYFFYLDVETEDDELEFEVRTLNSDTFDRSLTMNGTGVLTGLLEANQNDSQFRIYTKRDDTNSNSSFKINGTMLIDLTASFGVGNEPEEKDINRIVEMTGYFKGRRILSIREVNNYLQLEGVAQKVSGIEQNIEKSLVKVQYGANKYNPENNLDYDISGDAIGEKQTLYVLEGTDFVSQKIEIEPGKSISFAGIRRYSLVDSNDIVTLNRQTVSHNTSHTISNDAIPTGTRYIWVTTYENDINRAQVEMNDTLSQYKPYAVEGLYVGGNKILDLPVTGGGASNEDVYSTSQMLLKKNDLEEENHFFKQNSLSATSEKIEKEPTIRTVDLKSTNTQKLILHLHKRDNDGYDTNNDVYLPNAEDDFSDIKITDDTGEILPYRTIFRTNEFDVIPDLRIGRKANSYAYTDSSNRMINIYNRKISISEDVGKTWEPIPDLVAIDNPHITLLTSDDTLFFSKNGVLYRSLAPYTSYKEVLDTREDFTETHIIASNMAEHPDGELFVGGYQLERIIRLYRSTDQGETWQEVYRQPDIYQHVHSVFVDVHSNPVAIYAGLDQGGGVLKTTDKGETWIDLREENPDMPQATDFGVVYADPSGYRLLGGETSIVGGYTILKTTDDVNFKPVLAAGNGVYNIRKLNGKLYAGGVGTRGFQSAAIYMSADEGETWREVYTTSPLNDTQGASDGFRYVTLYTGDTEEQLIVSAQSESRSPLRIFPEGRYAEIIVDVPEGAEQLFVEDGFRYPYEKPITNDTEPEGDMLVHFNLNENGSVIKENVSDKLYSGDFEWVDSGKQLANFHPSIVSPVEKHSVLTKSLSGFDVASFDASEGITISFWGNLGYNRNIQLIKTESNDAVSIVGHQLRYNNGNSFAYIFPITLGTTVKVDIIIKADGSLTSYVNGQFGFTSSDVNYSDALTSIQNSSKLTLLNTLDYDTNDNIQNFSIRKGVISGSQLYQEYNSYITDNMED